MLSEEARAQAISSEAAFRTLSAEDAIALIRSGASLQTNAFDRMRIIFMLGRPRTSLPGMLTYILAASYAYGTISSRVFIGAWLAFMAAFVANVENAYSDLEEDIRNLPGRVYLLTRIGYHRLAIIMWVLNILMIVVAALVDVWVVLLTLIGLLIVHQYSFKPLRAKSRPFTGLLVFSLIVAYTYLAGLSADSDYMLAQYVRDTLAWHLTLGIEPSAGEILQSHRFLAMGTFVAVWFIAKGTFKNIPDYYGDLAAGIRTSATLFSSWHRAALFVLVFTTATYLSLGLLVLAGLEPGKLLWALGWTPVVVWNCTRLLRANDGKAANNCLRVDMLISSGFIASVLLLVAPSVLTVGTITVSIIIAVLSDLLRIDSRRAADTA